MTCGKLWTDLLKLQLFSIELNKFNELFPMCKYRTNTSPLTTEYTLPQKVYRRINSYNVLGKQSLLSLSLFEEIFIIICKYVFHTSTSW